MATFAAWIIGVAAGALQFIQAAISGPNAYTYLTAVVALLSGAVLLAYGIREGLVRYLHVLAAALPLMLGSTAFGYIVQAAVAPGPPPPPVSISIVSPAKNELVNHQVVVKGIVVNLPPGKQVWVAVTGRMDDVDIPYQYYVKGSIDKTPCVVAEQRFECSGIFVGVPGDASRYGLIPVIADQSQMEGIVNCMKDDTTQVSCANVRPDGIQLGAMVFVKRQP